jgi:hypothetical protein
VSYRVRLADIQVSDGDSRKFPETPGNSRKLPEIPGNPRTLMGSSDSVVDDAQTSKPTRRRRTYDPLRINRWCSDRELAKMQQGKVNGLDSIDVQSIMAGQAAKRIRDYSRPVRVWELDE